MGESVSIIEEDAGLGDGERDGLADIFAADAHGAGFGTEALTATLGALRVATIFAQHDADVELVFFALHLFEEAHDAGETIFAVEKSFALRISEVAPGDITGNAEGGCNLAQFSKPTAILGTIPGINCAIVEGE